LKVRYTPRARGDMDAILSYIDQRNPQGARNVARTMHKTIEFMLIRKRNLRRNRNAGTD
jgi:plasmid stabilization system protein ParE